MCWRIRRSFNRINFYYGEKGLYLLFYFIILVITVLIWPICGLFTKNQQQQIKIYLIFCWLIFTVVAGLRASTVGTDSIHYWQTFTLINEGYETILNTRYELFYFLLNRVVGFFTSEAGVFFLIESAITWACFMYFIKECSTSPVISVLLIQELYLFCSSLNISRAFLSLSITLVGYVFLNKRLFKQSIGFFIAGILIHQSIAIFVIVYFIARLKKVSDSTVVLAAIGSMLLVILSRPLVAIFSAIFPRYAIYQTTGNESQSLGAFPVMLLCIAIISLFISKKYNYDEKREVNKLALITVIGAAFLFVNAFGNISMAGRMAQYMISLTTLLPSMLTKNFVGKVFVGMVLIALLLYYFIQLNAGNAGVVPYSMWI